MHPEKGHILWVTGKTTTADLVADTIAAVDGDLKPGTWMAEPTMRVGTTGTAARAAKRLSTRVAAAALSVTTE